MIARKSNLWRVWARERAIAHHSCEGLACLYKMSISLTRLVSIFRFWFDIIFIKNSKYFSPVFFPCKLIRNINQSVSFFLYGCAATSNGLTLICCCCLMRLHRFQCVKRSFADCISRRHH